MSLLYSNSFKYEDGEFRKNQGFTDFNHHSYQQQHHNSGLMRYCSAPTSFLDTLYTENVAAGIDETDDFRFFRSSSPEAGGIMARFVLPSNIGSNLEEYGERSAVKQEMEDSGRMAHNEMGNYGNSVNTMEDRFGLQPITKMNTVNGSNLLRQNSSPPGFFSNQGVDHNERINLPQIAELGEENAASTNPESNINAKRKYINFDSWIDSSSSRFKRLRDNNNNNDGISFSASNILENQNGNCGNGLTHHHSLPKTASEMATIEKFLKFQGSPCKIRAKRGFATHPRSIAERVRRTRISDRMRKLQDLFPNLDKQTNTADMLDMAVEYIKDLQKEVKNLADIRSKCRCSSSHELINSNATL